MINNFKKITKKEFLNRRELKKDVRLNALYSYFNTLEQNYYYDTSVMNERLKSFIINKNCDGEYIFIARYTMGRTINVSDFKRQLSEKYISKLLNNIKEFEHQSDIKSKSICDYSRMDLEISNFLNGVIDKFLLNSKLKRELPKNEQTRKVNKI